MSFSDRYGEAMGQRLRVWTSVTDDADLPEIHRILLKTPKGSQYGAINALLQERAAASPLNIAHMNAPTVTPKLVKDVFRSYQPAPTGLEFSRGLSPFAVVCQGHAGVKEVEMMVRDASLIDKLDVDEFSVSNSTLSFDLAFFLRVA